MVVLGAFVQFYMRAGVFTDGGKRERERAARPGQEAAPGPTASIGPRRPSPVVIRESEETLLIHAPGEPGD